MDEVVYEALERYFYVLSKVGYLPDGDAQSLLVLSFYKDFVFEDYRGILSREDYGLIERALNCLYGNNCLIPYPNYLKMGKLNLGQSTEIVTRIKHLEDTKAMQKNKTVASDVPDIDIEEIEEV